LGAGFCTGPSDTTLTDELGGLERLAMNRGATRPVFVAPSRLLNLVRWARV